MKHCKHFKQGIKSNPRSNLENGSVESDMDCKDLVPEVSSEKNITTMHSCDALAKDEAAFFFFPFPFPKRRNA